MRVSTVYGLVGELRTRGILQRASKHIMSADKKRLILYYYNSMLESSFMCICRSSKLCFYVFVENEKKTFRTQKQIVEFLDDFYTDNGEWVDYVNYVHASKMLENRFYHSRIENRKRDYENWKVQRKKEIARTLERGE